MSTTDSTVDRLTPHKKAELLAAEGDPEAVVAPPSGSGGPLAWMRQNLFGSVRDSIITIVLVAIIAYLGYGFLNWLVFNSTWNGNEVASCTANSSGFCWPYLRDKYRFILFGTYPYAEQWRPTLMMIITVLMLAASCDRRMWNWRMAAMWIVGALVSALLLFGVLVFPLWFFLAVAMIGALIAAGMVFRGGNINLAYGLLGAAALAGIAMVLCWFGLLPSWRLRIDAFTFVETTSWGGLPVTLVLAVVALAGAFPLAILLALGRRSNLPLIKALCVGFIELIRGVPLISLLIMASVMLPLFLPTGVSIDKLLRAIVGMMLFAAAYLAEVIRGGLQAIPKGQYEAADAMGMSYFNKTRLIILPQALRLVIPPLVNTFIGFFKDTSLVYIIGIFDLLTAGDSALKDPAWRAGGFSPANETYLFLAVIYFVFCFSMSRYSQYLERDLNKSQRR